MSDQSRPDRQASFQIAAWLRAGLLAAGVCVSTGLVAHPDLIAQIEAITEQLNAPAAGSTPAAELLLQRGDLYRRHEDFVSAAQDFAAARQQDPAHPWLDLYEGRLSLEAGDTNRALQLLQRYVTQYPDHALGWQLHGRALLALGQFGDASESFGRSIETSENPGPELYRLQVLSLISSGAAYTESLAPIDAGLDQFGIEVTLLGIGTDVALAEGDTEQAASYMETLPAGLLRLEDWSNRAAILRCIQSSDPDVANPCRAEAATHRLQLIHDFEAEVQPKNR